LAALCRSAAGAMDAVLPGEVAAEPPRGIARAAHGQATGWHHPPCLSHHAVLLGHGHGGLPSAVRAGAPPGQNAVPEDWRTAIHAMAPGALGSGAGSGAQGDGAGLGQWWDCQCRPPWGGGPLAAPAEAEEALLRRLAAAVVAAASREASPRAPEDEALRLQRWAEACASPRGPGTGCLDVGLDGGRELGVVPSAPSAPARKPRANPAAGAARGVPVAAAARPQRSAQRRVAPEEAPQQPRAAEAQRAHTVMACLTILEIGIFVFCVVVNKGLESLEENPMLGPNSATLYLAGGLHLQEGQYWRLFTCIFLHAGVFHLLPNMLVQWWIGASVEAHWGAWWTAALYLLSGLGGSLLSAVLSDPAQLSVGASGALHGLMAAGAAGGAGELGWPATLKAAPRPGAGGMPS